MSLGLSESRRRSRRKRWWAFWRFLFYCGLLVAAGFAGYEYATERAQAVEARLRAEIQELRDDRDAAEQAAVQAEATAQSAEMRFTDLATRYERDVPGGVVRQFIDLVSSRLEAGVSAERLAFFIRAADEPRDCSPAETHTFFVRTPVFGGSNTSARFAGGRITVSGEGANAIGANGGPEAWFDPNQEVAITFAFDTGHSLQIDGVLPLQHSLVFDGAEFRFTVVAGRRSFVDVTADRCAFLSTG